MSECPICFEFLENQNEIVKTNCNHQFCFVCLSEWLRRNPDNYTCPICRSNINNCVISINDPSCSDIEINLVEAPITTQMINTFSYKFICTVVLIITFFLILLFFTNK